MNISKPTKFQHNIHATYDPSIGDVVLCKSKYLMTDVKEMNISGPTEFKHNIHAKCDPRTGKVVMFSPKVDSLNSKDDESYDCNNCNELYYQWKRDQVKIKELQEENHFMLAMAARLCLYASNTDGCSAYDNEFGYSSYGNVKMREFTESMNFIAQALITMGNNQVSSALNQDMSVFELKKENELLKKDLQQINSDRNRLNEEVTTTMHQLLRTSNSSPRPTVGENSDSEDNDRNGNVDCRNQHTTSSGKQVSYNITASAVNFIDKSSVKYDHRGGEISETVI